MAWRIHLDRARRDQTGFSLVEVAVAMGVIFVLLLALVYTGTAALNNIGFASQRQGATSIANDVMERVRGLEFGAIEQGLSIADPQFDPALDVNIVDCSAEEGYCFRAPDGEPIVASPALSPRAPLVPHRQVIPSNDETSTQYERLVYITRVAPDDDAPSGTYRAVVIVSWGSSFNPSLDTHVETQTLLFNPSGCPDPSMTPVASPCRSAFFGTASSSQGGVQITGSLLGTPVEASVHLVGVRGDMQLVQVDSVQADVQGSRATLDGQAVGGQGASAAADNDPQTSQAPYTTNELSDPAPGSLSVGTVASLGLSTGADTGRATSATAAAANFPAQECPRPAGPVPLQTDGKPCTHAWGQQGGALAAALGLSGSVLGLNVNLGSATLVGVPVQANPSWAIVDRQAEAASDGRLASSASRSIPNVELLGLPTVFPGAPSSLVRVTGYQDAVHAEAGTDSAPPAVSIASGAKIEYWNGSQFVELPVGGSANVGVNLNVGLNVGFLLAANARVEVTGTVARGATTVVDPDGPSSGTTRSQARAEIESPLIASFTYKVTVSTLTQTQVLADLQITVDLGTLLARASYQEGS